MTPLEAARALAAGDPIARGADAWCVFCGSCEWAHDINDVQHAPACPWLALPQIVAALEQQAVDADEDAFVRCEPCLAKVYSGLGSFPWTCRNGHTVYSSGGPLTARQRLAPGLRLTARADGDPPTLETQNVVPADDEESTHLTGPPD